MAKIDVLNKALEMGLSATEDMTVAEIQKLIDASEGGPGIKDEKNYFVEYDVQITKTVKDGRTTNGYEKLKVSRPCVKISEEEAETLNAGILDGGNTYAKMYFKPE